MNLIPTHQVPSLPADIILAWDTIQECGSGSLPFVDAKFMQVSTNNKRKNEHYAARKLFGNLVRVLKLPTNSVQLKKMELGKPYGLIGDEMLYTSFSHCEDWVVCGLSRKLDLGVDCEPLDREVNPRIFDRILDESEKNILDELSHLAIWAMKEAVVKCIGTGIRTSLQKYPLIKEDNVYTVRWENERINIVPFIWEHHQLAVAWRK